MESRVMELEMALAGLHRDFEELNQVVVEQGKKIDFLVKQNRVLMEGLAAGAQAVKPLEEEVAPPHY